MGRLVVIEGLDGAGKRTLSDGLVAALTARGAKVVQMAFPRYGINVHADLARDALYGRLGDLAASVHGMAVLFALDRRDAADQLRALRRRYDVVLLDRYVASNAAYGAARLHENADGPFVAWVRGLEVDRFGVPVPDIQVLLRVPMSIAAARADRRAKADRARAKDLYETDRGLQARCAAVYDGLAAGGWLTPWSVIDGITTVSTTAVTDSTGSTPSDLAVQILGG
ncbi:MAG: dTMP kinase [Actinomycetota bacterium]|nr:dTMP kinase [Actinomycetota bacterium]